MREDVLFSLRNGVMEEIANINIINNLKNKPKNLSIRKYYNVSIDHFFENDESELVYSISFKHRQIKWKYSKKLIYGSLVLLLNKKQLEHVNDNGDEINIDMIWCTVADRDIKYLEAKRPMISLQLRKGNICTKYINGKPEFIMVESSDAYFLPYMFVIKGLKQLGDSVNVAQQNDIIPFENILVSAEKNAKLPSYLTNDMVWNFKCILNEPYTLRKMSGYFGYSMTSESYSFNVVKDWPKDLNTSLDDNQLIALKHMLTNQVAVVQGPPGTGKTYLALKTLNILLTNLKNRSKILVAALTNHALDQLLCGILQFEDSIIRIGSRSQCEQLKDKSIKSMKRQYLWGKGVHNDCAKIQWHDLRKEKQFILGSLEQLYVELHRGFTETLLRKYKIIHFFKFNSMERHLKQWRERRHEMDNKLYSLSRLQKRQNEYGFNANYNHYHDHTNAAKANKQKWKVAGAQANKTKANKWKVAGARTNKGKWQIAGSQVNKGKWQVSGTQTIESNYGKWQVVGNAKKQKKVLQMFDNYHIENPIELYLNEPYFMERIKMRQNDLQNTIQQQRLYSLGLPQHILEQNLRDSKVKTISTTQFIKLSSIPTIYENDIEIEIEIKEEKDLDEEKKEAENEEENEIESLMEDRKFLDNLFADMKEDESDGKKKSIYKQIDRLNNKMVSKDWNFVKINNKEQKKRIEELKKYECDLEIAIKERINQQLIKLRKINKEIKEMNTLIETNLIQKSKVIGITTTAAARLMDVINEVKPNILIFEEAAEILESHIITALNPNLEHLILIGDHKQLRPTAATYKLVTENNLEISLFERLILSGIDHKVLNVQRRMIPQICELSALHYDDEKFEIENHESTLIREDIAGISKNVIFFNHTNREEEDENIQSKYNIFEAQMIIELTIYLLKQKIYKPSDITILTLYRGQQLKIKSLARKNHILQNLLNRNTYDLEKKNSSLNVKCVDKYQGEENDIILLSLVRSNKKSKIGFLSIDNRICVALSRAKNGLYAFGDFNLYSSVSKTWEKITHIATTNNYLQDKIELKCKRHENVINVKQPKDFQNSPEGGCSMKCEERMECGHVCPRLCHSYDHKYIKCLKPCTKVHEKCEHKCRKKCGEECGECTIIVTKTVPGCGHIIGVECYRDISSVKCPKMIDKSFEKCKHIKKIHCYQRIQAIECSEIIDLTFENCQHKINNVKCKDKFNKKYANCKSKCDQILECGHKCKEICFKCCENNNKHKCGFKCNRIMVCGHECNRVHPCKQQCAPCDKDCENACPHSKCNKKCGEICVVCQEACTRSCIHHKCTAVCSQQCNFIRCNKACNQELECGYKCPGVCGEECLSFCKEEKCEVHHLNGSWDEYNYYTNYQPTDATVFDEDFMSRQIYECGEESMFIILTDCGHIIERTAIDRYVSDYRKNNSRKIKLIPCPLCQKPIRKCKRYINIINTILNDIEHVKKEIINNQFEVVKRNIVSAMSAELGRSKGHYFKCANGHYYIVGECGGPTQTAKCPECDEIIGTNHRIANGSQLATEMDGAWQPKYPTVLQ